MCLFQEWGKANKKGEIKNGVLEGRIYNGKGIETIGDLPSKDQLYAQVSPPAPPRKNRDGGARVSCEGCPSVTLLT